MRYPLIKSEDKLKKLMRAVCLFVTFGAALALAQQSASTTGRTSTRQQSKSSAAKWGPTRNPTEAAGPRAESAASSRALKSAEPQPGSAHAMVNKDAAPAGHTAGTAAAAGGDASTSTSEHPGFGGFSGKGHASASSGGSKAKKNASGVGSRKASLGKHRGTSGGHSYSRSGDHKTTKHSTW